MKYLAAIILCVFTAAVAIAAINDAKLILENADGTNRQQTLTDPGADRLMIWDDSENAFAYVDGATALVTLGLTATASEINTPLDGALVTLDEFQELETLGTTDIEAADWTALAALVGVNTGDSQTLAAGVSDVTATAGEVNLLDIGTSTEGWVLAVDAGGTTASWKAQSGGSGAFSDAADPAVLNTTTKEVEIGATLAGAAKLTVHGDADEPQLFIQGHTTQTNNIFTMEDSAGTDLLTLNNSGDLEISGDLVLAGTVSSGLDMGTASITSGDIIPTTDSTYDIGSTTERYAEGWFDDLTVGGTSTFATLDITGALSVGSFKLNDTDSAFELELQSTSTLTADRILTIDAEDAASTLTIGASTTLSGGTHSGTNTGDQTTVTGNAGTVTIADAAGDTTTFPLLGTAATGSLAPATDAGLSYNATTDTLEATAMTVGGDEVVTLVGAQTLSNKTLSSPTISGPSFSADSLDAILEIAAALKSGSDGTLVTGTSGLTGNLVMWDANGDAIASGADSADPAFTTVDANSYTSNPGSGIDAQAAGALDIGNTTATSIDFGSNGVTAHTFASDNADDVILDGSDSSIGGSGIIVAADQLSALATGGTISPDLIDAVGAVDQDYGSADILDHTFASNGGTVIIDGADSTIDGSAIAVAADTLDFFAAGGTPLDKSTTLEIYTQLHSATHTISSAECYGGVHYVDTTAVVITLPAATDGMSVTVATIGAVAVTVDADLNDQIYLDGSLLDDGDSIDNLTTSGDLAVFTYITGNDGDGGRWYAATNGWTDGGP